MQSTDSNQPETVEVESLVNACDGGGGAQGHPKVYLTITQEKGNSVDCTYCSKRFVLKEGAKLSGHH